MCKRKRRNLPFRPNADAIISGTHGVLRADPDHEYDEFDQLNSEKVADTTNIEMVSHFFKEGYEYKNYDLVMSYLSDDYLDTVRPEQEEIPRPWKS